MKINKIQKMTNNRYKIILDSSTFITFDNVILKYNLLYKNDLTQKELNTLIKESNYYEAYNKTLKYTANKIRSKNSVENYINKFNLKDEEKNKIITKLKELKFINDELYCKSFINDKIYLNKYGVNKIRNLLIKQEIDIDIINKNLANIDTEKIDCNLENKVKKKIQSNHKYSNYELRNKLISYFMNEGYEKAKIIYYLDKYQKNDDNILEKEFDKLYYKYKNKYEYNIFIFKLKQKLIQKGFSIDLINSLIQKKTGE